MCAIDSGGDRAVDTDRRWDRGVCGPVGVGKTRLVREVLARLSGVGRPVEWAAATPATSAIRVRRRVTPAGGGRRTCHRWCAVEWSSGWPQAGTTVIGMDDAHLLDEASAVVTHHLALRARVTLSVTVRHSVGGLRNCGGLGCSCDRLPATSAHTRWDLRVGPASTHYIASTRSQQPDVTTQPPSTSRTQNSMVGVRRGLGFQRRSVRSS